MDSQNNETTPGIIGIDNTDNSADTSAPSANAPDKLFDSSAFTGEPEPIVTTTEDKKEPGVATMATLDKAKKPSLFTKWQTWAIASGAILVCSIAVMVIMGISFGGQIEDARSISGYDSARNLMNEAVADYKAQFKTLSNDSYNIASDGSSFSQSIAPTDEQFNKAQNECLKKHGATDEGIEMMELNQTGEELVRSGKNIKKMKELAGAMTSAARNARASVSTCSDIIYEPFYEMFEISFGEVKDDGGEENTTMRYASQKVTIKNKTDRDVSSLYMTFTFVDQGGVESNNSSKYLSVSDLKAGGTVELDMYNSGSYRIGYKDISALKSLKPKLIKVSGMFKFQM